MEKSIDYFVFMTVEREKKNIEKSRIDRATLIDILFCSRKKLMIMLSNTTVDSLAHRCQQTTINDSKKN